MGLHESELIFDVDHVAGPGILPHTLWQVISGEKNKILPDIQPSKLTTILVALLYC